MRDCPIMLMESIITQRVVCYGYGEKIKGKDEISRSIKQHCTCSACFVVVVQSIHILKSSFVNRLIV